MAKLKCFSIPGLLLWFYSNDHEPPHFHAKRKGEWELRVKFLENAENMFELKWSKSKGNSVSVQDRKLIKELVEKNRFELLQEWEKVHRS